MGMIENLRENFQEAERAYIVFRPHLTFSRQEIYQRFFSDADYQKGLMLIDKIESVTCESDPIYFPLCSEFRELIEKIKNKEGFECQ